MATICEKCVVGVEDGGGASGECSIPTRAVGACRALTTGVCVVRVLRRVQERAQQYACTRSDDRGAHRSRTLRRVWRLVALESVELVVTYALQVPEGHS